MRPARLYAILGLAFVAAACGGPTAPGNSARASFTLPERLEHASTPETHRQAVLDLFETLRIAELYASSVEQTMTTMAASDPNVSAILPVLRDFFARYANFASLRDEMAQLYIDTFSELEVRQLIVFYRTPIGSRAVEELPRLMASGSGIGQRAVQEHRAELDRMVREHMMRGSKAMPPATGPR